MFFLSLSFFFSFSLSSSLSRLPTHTRFAKFMPRRSPWLVFARRDVNSNSNRRSCRRWNGKGIVQLATGTSGSRWKEITLLHLIDRYSRITWSLFFRFDSRPCQVTETALWDAKRCRREGQRVLDQTASSESKDTGLLQHKVL